MKPADRQAQRGPAESRWERLVRVAGEEVERLLCRLPPDLRERAGDVPVTYERRPSRALERDGVASDTMGLFVGDPFPYDLEVSGDVPAQVILFLENIWEEADGDEPIYREEVRTTMLHELGHYLGLDEHDLELRDLE